MSNIDTSKLITAAQIEVMLQETLRKAATAERNKLLAETDWTALNDTTANPKWVKYRQDLRDVTAQKEFPKNVEWPTKPD